MTRRVLLMLALAATPATARAHEYWLAPSAYAGATGDTVRVGVWVGTGFRGEPKPWAATRSLRFDAREAAVHDLQTQAINGEETWATLVLADAGGVALAFQSDFSSIELPGPQFEAYLKLEGLAEPHRLRAEAGRAATPGRERYARCARAWIAGDDPTRVTRPAGLTFELVPLTDPTQGRGATFQLLLRGQPHAGALVRAWRRPLASRASPFAASARDSTPPVFEARSDAAGRVRIPIESPGEWMVASVHMEPSTSPREGDWQSWWASFTFARPQLGRPERQGRR